MPSMNFHLGYKMVSKISFLTRYENIFTEQDLFILEISFMKNAESRRLSSDICDTAYFCFKYCSVVITVE